MTGSKLYFCNPGEADIRAITTLGVNVKDGPVPIGHFGTGVKYAIAGVLRLGGSIRMFSGEHEYHFVARNENIRGREFGLVFCETAGGTTPLGFTTELGKDWEPWMIYRELRSNAIDEGGDCQTEEPHEAEGTTVIEVDCPELAAVHEQRSDFWLESTPIWTGGGVEIHEGRTHSLFYHGIRASNEQHQKSESWHYSYSFTREQKLTEDRTFADWYSVRQTLGKALLTCDNTEILETVLAYGPEDALDYDWTSINPSPEFVEVVLGRIRAKQSVPATAREAVKRYREEELDEAEGNIPDSWEEMLAKGEQGDSDVPDIRASKYDWSSEAEARIDGLEQQVKYWRNCAVKLAKGQQS